MQLNEIHDPHEHASVSLKVILLVFAVILVGVLGYLVWQQNNEPSLVDNSGLNTNSENGPGATQLEPKEGWTRFADKEIGVSFNYPKSWGWLMLETVSDSDVENTDGKTFSITIATTAQRSKTGAERLLPISMGGQSKDFRTTVGKGLGFSDYDAYKVEAGKYSVAHYSWTDGKLGTYRGIPTSSNPAEVNTVDGKALVITDAWVDDSGYPYLADNAYGAIVPLSAASNYHAIGIAADSELVSESDFLDFIKSFTLI